MSVIPVVPGKSPAGVMPGAAPNDPMAELFGPGSNTRLIGNPEDQVPEQVRALFDQYGLGQKGFQCALKELPEGANIGDGVQTSAQNTRYIKGWSRAIPSFEYIKNNHGPGLYVLSFSWRQLKAEGDGTEAKYEEVVIEISPKAAEEHRKFILQNKIKNASEVSTQVRDELIEKKIEGQMVGALTGDDPNKAREDPTEAAKKYLTGLMDTAKALGLPVGQQKTIEWDKLIAVAAPIVTALITANADASRRREEDFNKLLLMMMSQGQAANQSMLQMVTSMQGGGTGQHFIKEFTEMVKGAFDLKQMLNPPEETLGDKVFRVIEAVAPQVLTIAQTMAQRAPGAPLPPVAQMAAGYVNKDPDFQALKGNPAELKKTVDKMDDYFGWEQTDMIMNVMGFQRPAACPRDPARREPPAEVVEDTNVVEPQPPAQPSAPAA